MLIGLFLGSGASSFAGLPTSNKIIEESGFKDNLQYNEILKKCDSEDIEEVLQKIEVFKNWIEDGENIFDGWIHNILSYQEPSNVSPNQNPTYSLQVFKAICTNMQSGTIELLPELFTIKENQKVSINSLYKPFLNYVGGINSSVDIFTTNYDSVIKEFVHLQPSGYQYNDGFPSEKISEFSLKQLTNPNINGSDITLNLYRLHGGLDWYKSTNGESDKENIYKNFDLRQISKNEGILVPPILGKNVKDHPLLKPIYDVFAQKFLEYDICIVIGFSFRDKDIAEVISNRINRNKTTIMIGPHIFTDISKNLFPYEANMEKEEFHESRGRDMQNKHPSLKCLATRFLPENLNEITEFIQKQIDQEPNNMKIA